MGWNQLQDSGRYAQIALAARHKVLCMAATHLFYQELSFLRRINRLGHTSRCSLSLPGPGRAVHAKMWKYTLAAWALMHILLYSSNFYESILDATIASNSSGFPRYTLQTSPWSLPMYVSDANYMNSGKNYVHKKRVF